MTDKQSSNSETILMDGLLAALSTGQAKKTLFCTLYLPSRFADDTEDSFKLDLDTSVMLQFQKLTDICVKNELLFAGAVAPSATKGPGDDTLVMLASRKRVWLAVPNDDGEDSMSVFVPFGELCKVFTTRVETEGFKFYGDKLLYAHPNNLAGFAEQLYYSGDLGKEFFPADMPER